MKVLAVGAAGSSAGLVVSALAARGVEVRGLIHSPEREAMARQNGASEVVVADLLDREALKEAVNGVDGVFHIIPAFVADEAATGVALVEVAQEAGIRRFVFSSVYHPSLTDLSNHRDKQPAERALYDGAMEFTILQPAMFMSQLKGVVDQAKRTGTISGPYSSASQMTYVDYRDVAEVAATSFITDEFVNGTFELSASGTYSRDDLARLLSKSLAQPVRAESVSGDLPDQMPASMREGLAKMFEHYDKSGFRGGNSFVLTQMLGRAPKSVPEYLAELAGE